MAKGDRFKLLIRFIKSIRETRGYDCCICITGAEQSGKSTLAVKIVQALQGGEIDLKKNIGYKTSECLEEIKDIPQNGCYIIDEAIRAFYKRDWSIGSHKELTRIFAQIGMKKAVFIFNIPNFLDLDRFYRNHRIRIWIHVLGNRWNKPLGRPDLFYAVVFLRDNSPSNPDPWFLASMWGLEKKSILENKMQPMFFTDKMTHMLERLEKFPTFKWHFTYPPLDNALWKRYSTMSAKRKMDDDAVDTSDKNRVALKNISNVLRHVKGHTCREIADYTAHPNSPDKPIISGRTIQRWTKDNSQHT